MFDIDRWREIFQSINKNRLRSILSGFTVAFAILLFTLLFGIGNGLQNTFKEQFAGDATNSIYVGSGRTTKPYKEKFSNEIHFISPRVDRSANVVFNNKQDNYTIRGVYPGYDVLESASIFEGRFLNYLDVKNKLKVAVIGNMVEKDLFRGLSAYGKEINIGGIIYKVVGVFTDPGGDSDERFIYTPYTTMQQIYGANDNIDNFGMTYNPDLSIDAAIIFGNKMKRALDEFVIEGIKTTIPFHRQLMDHPDYLSGNYTTKFMEDFVMNPPEQD